MPSANEPPGFRLGYQLRLPNGPRITPEDSLLSVFGAVVVALHEVREHDEAVQDEGFAPGQSLSLLEEGCNEQGEAVVSVWNTSQTLRAGVLPDECAARVCAANDYRLELRALSLEERRTPFDDRRSSLRALLYSPQFVSLTASSQQYQRPSRPGRRRVVLVADAKNEVRWWDPVGQAGPAAISELPLSRELHQDLIRLAEAFTELRAHGDVSGFAAIELEWQQEELTDHAVRVWRRARRELGRDYAIGFQGPDMERPAWSPEELQREHGEDDGWERF